MANFDLAYAPLLKNEGGYANNQKDNGKETYKGVSRVFWSGWNGWSIIDSYKSKPNFPKSLDSDIQLSNLVKDFYKVNFWNPIKGDQIFYQSIADSIFDFAVNGGVKQAVVLAQRAIETIDDGVLGENTLSHLNTTTDEELFITKYALEKIKFYIKCVEADKSQMTFFFGWVKRSVNQL